MDRGKYKSENYLRQVVWILDTEITLSAHKPLHHIIRPLPIRIVLLRIAPRLDDRFQKVRELFVGGSQLLHGFKAGRRPWSEKWTDLLDLQLRRDELHSVFDGQSLVFLVPAEIRANQNSSGRALGQFD